MVDTALVSTILKRNRQILQMQMSGLSHEDCLLQPPDGGNCANWLLGHIVDGRNSMLRRLGETPLWDDETSEMYTRGSEPITGPDKPHLHLNQLWADLERAEDRLLVALASVNEETLAEIPGGLNLSLGELLEFLAWHETYHVGQMEQYRRLSGRRAKVL